MSAFDAFYARWLSTAALAPDEKEAFAAECRDAAKNATAVYASEKSAATKSADAITAEFDRIIKEAKEQPQPAAKESQPEQQQQETQGAATTSDSQAQHDSTEFVAEKEPSPAEEEPKPLEPQMLAAPLSDADSNAEHSNSQAMMMLSGESATFHTATPTEFAGTTRDETVSPAVSPAAHSGATAPAATA
jgi:chemotaxis protein histidine kinase CheA